MPSNNLFRSPLGRYFVVLAAVAVTIVIGVMACIRENNLTIADVGDRIRTGNLGPMRKKRWQLLPMRSALKQHTVRVAIRDEKDCLAKNKIDLDALKEKIGNALDATVSDTACDVAQVTLTVFEREGVPGTMRHLIMTHLTVSMPDRPPGGGPGSEIVYDDQHSNIYASENDKQLESAIDSAINTMQSSYSLTYTKQNNSGVDSKVLKMYEAPQKTIDGRQAPTENGKERIK